jgi:hypothetical protein
MELKMTSDELKQYYEKMVSDCDVHIDSNGDFAPAEMSNKIEFEIEGDYLRVTYDLFNDDEAAKEIGGYANDNPCYYWLDAAYLVCAMQQCGYKMLPYTEALQDDLDVYMHNGHGVQIIFKKM